MEVVIGVDGGGSKTALAMARSDDGTLLGRVSVDGSNVLKVGGEHAAEAIIRSIEGLLEPDGRTQGDVTAIVAGLAGVDATANGDLISTRLRRAFPAATCTVTSDADLVLSGGTPHGHGAAIIAGTGSIALARDPAGTVVRAGGWGTRLGDEGSAFDIGIAGLQAVCQAWDGRIGPTALLHRLGDTVDTRSRSALIRSVEAMAPKDIAALAPAVAETASAGDDAARRIIGRAAVALAGLVEAVHRSLAWSGPMPLALGGGLLCNTPGLSEALLDRLRDAGVIDGSSVSFVHDPCAVAIEIALASVAPSDQEDASGRVDPSSTLSRSRRRKSP